MEKFNGLEGLRSFRYPQPGGARWLMPTATWISGYRTAGWKLSDRHRLQETLKSDQHENLRTRPNIARRQPVLQAGI